MTLFRLETLLTGIAVVACAAALAGCSSERTSDWGEVYTMMRNVIAPGDNAIRIEQAAAIPYATIGVRVDGGAEGMLVLATDNGHEHLWTSASRVALLIRGGRIVRSAGLEHNLTEARVWGGAAAEPSITESMTTRWEMDFADLGLFSVPVVCKSVVRGREPVKNFNVDVDTVRVDEDCHSDKLDWSFVNSYWIAPSTGLCWHAIQYISPKLGPIETEILRAPAAG